VRHAVCDCHLYLSYKVERVLCHTVPLPVSVQSTRYSFSSFCSISPLLHSFVFVHLFLFLFVTIQRFPQDMDFFNHCFYTFFFYDFTLFCVFYSFHPSCSGELDASTYTVHSDMISVYTIQLCPIIWMNLLPICRGIHALLIVQPECELAIKCVRLSTFRKNPVSHCNN